MQPRVNQVTDNRAMIRIMQAEIQELKKQLKIYHDQDWRMAEDIMEELRIKSEEARMTAEQRDRLQQKLEGLERLILRGDSYHLPSGVDVDSAPAHKSRQSCTHEAFVSAPPHGPQLRREDCSDRHCGAPPQQAEGSHATPRKSLHRDNLLLDCFLAPSARPPSTVSTQEQLNMLHCSVMVKRTADERARAREMQNLQGPSGEQAQKALVALQAEVRCIKQIKDLPLEDTAAALQKLKSELQQLEASMVQGRSIDSNRQETLEALRLEVTRLQQTQSAHERAVRALESLQSKIRSLQSSEDISSLPWTTPATHSSTTYGTPTPHQGSKESWKRLSIMDKPPHTDGSSHSPSSPPLLGSPVQGSCSPADCSARATSPLAFDMDQHGSCVELTTTHTSVPEGRESDQDNSFKAELQRMHDAFKVSAEKDVSALREVLQEYKERIDRLETQKKVLLNQVLKLEYLVEESDVMRQELVAEVQELKTERDQMREGAKQAMQQAKMQGHSPLSNIDGVQSWSGTREAKEKLGFYDGDDNHWASNPTTDTLMPQIIRLWEELYVPLAYRSRFYLAFRGRELFYYEVEFRRLEWKRSHMHQSDGGGSQELDRAARHLDWERKSLAYQIKWVLNEEEREALYQDWNIDPLSKERKLQLVRKLWDKETLKTHQGMQKSAALVVRLCGMDASDHVMELVFGNFQREYATVGVRPPSSSLGIVLRSTLQKVILTPRGKRSESVLTCRPSTGAGSFTSRLHSGMMSVISGARRTLDSGSFTSAGSVGNSDFQRPTSSAV